MKGATTVRRDAREQIHISIHAPVKGATTLTAVLAPGLQISIHAPVKGATATFRTAAKRPADFNPRSREGSDRHYDAWW